MQSTDLLIRTERNVIDVVISLEGQVQDLRQEFEVFRDDVRNEFKNVRQEMKDGLQALSHQQEILASEVRSLDRTIGTMTTIFGWGFALIAIAVAIAPMLREFFTYRREKLDDAALERKIREILDTMNQ